MIEIHTVERRFVPGLESIARTGAVVFGLDAEWLLFSGPLDAPSSVPLGGSSSWEGGRWKFEWVTVGVVGRGC